MRDIHSVSIPQCAQFESNTRPLGSHQVPSKASSASTWSKAMWLAMTTACNAHSVSRTLSCCQDLTVFNVNHTGTKTPGACCLLTADKALPTLLVTAADINGSRLGYISHVASPQAFVFRHRKGKSNLLNPWCPGTHRNTTIHAAHAQCTNISLASAKQIYSRASMGRQMCSFLKQGDQAHDGATGQIHTAWVCCATPSLSMCSRSIVRQATQPSRGTQHT
jgi:hypothetical protein